MLKRTLLIIYLLPLWALILTVYALVLLSEASPTEKRLAFLTTPPPASNQTQVGSGAISDPATGLPDADSPPVDPTAFMQTQQAALDQSHRPGPTLGPGDSPVTPTFEPPTEVEPLDEEQSQGSGTVSSPATGLPGGDFRPSVDATAFMQTQEAALDQSHRPGPTLGPGDSPVIPTFEPPTDVEPSAAQKQPMVPCIAGLGGGMLLGIVAIIGGRRLILQNRQSGEN